MSKTQKKTVKTTLQINKPQDFPIWVVFVFFVLTTVIFFGSQLFGDTYFWEDFAEFVYPVQSFAAKSSDTPFWNPYTFVGMPFLADIQVGYFYPFNRLLDLFIDSSGKLSVAGLQFTVILHYFIAQITMFFFARRYGISKIGSLISSTAYAFSMLMVCHGIHPMMIYHLAWLPMVLMFLHRAIDESRIKYAVYGGLVLGMSFLAGHPQTLLYEGMFIGIYFVWTFISKYLEKTLQGIDIILSGVSGFVVIIIAIGIFSIQYLPTSELADNTKREEMSYEKASEGSLQVKQVYNSVVPKVFGYIGAENDFKYEYYLDENGQQKYFLYWDTAFYFSIAVLILGLFGLIQNYNNSIGSMFLFFVVFGLLFALGSNAFVYNIFHNLPLFGNFRNPSKILFFVVLSMTVMAGFGFDTLWKHIKDRKVSLKFLIAGIMPLLLAFLVASGIALEALGTPEQLRDEISGFGVMAIVFVLSTMILAHFINRGQLKPLIGGSLFVLLVFIDLYAAGGGFNQNPRNPEDQYVIPSQQMKDEFTPNTPSEIFRVNSRMYNPPYMTMNRNQGMIDNIMLIEGYNPLQLKWIRPPVKSDSDVHRLYNVKYELQLNPQSGQPAFAIRDNRLGNAWMSFDVKVLSESDIENAMSSKEYDIAKTVFLEKQPSIDIEYPNDSSYSPLLKCTKYENNVITYLVETDYNGVLCFSEMWYPAWKVYIDGKESELLKANYSFRAVAVSKGKHTIEMRYESSSYSKGKMITLTTLLLSLAFIGFAEFKDRKQK